VFKCIYFLPCPRFSVSSSHRIGAVDWESEMHHWSVSDLRTAQKPRFCFRGCPWLCKGV